MPFEWNVEKSKRNLDKHSVSFELAERVFDDPFHVVLPDRIDEGEQRWHAVGLVKAVMVLVVVHTYPNPDDDGLIRIISARKATRLERNRYEQQAI